MVCRFPRSTCTRLSNCWTRGIAIFVDVRDALSYGAGHICGAQHLNDQNVPDFVEAADKTVRLIVYCYRGHSSLDATAWLLRQGFCDVASLAGGFDAWRTNYPDQIE
jgi:thiosulfate sulfurtransferase